MLQQKKKTISDLYIVGYKGFLGNIGKREDDGKEWNGRGIELKFMSLTRIFITQTHFFEGEIQIFNINHGE